MAKIEFVSNTETSIKVRVSDWPDDTYYIRFYVGLVETDMPYDGYKEAIGLTSVTYTVTGLEPATYYGIKVLPVGSANTNADRTEDPTTEWFWTAAAGRPDDWEWTSTVSKGAAMDYDKISDTEYEVYPLTAREWNNFIDRVFEFLVYTGGSYNGDPTSWYVTRGAEMLAEDVENVRQLIAALDPPVAVPSAVSSDDKFKASFFNGLRDSLNSIE